MSQITQQQLSSVVAQTTTILTNAESYLNELTVQIADKEKQLQKLETIKLALSKEFPILDAKLRLDELEARIVEKEQEFLDLQKMGIKFALLPKTMEQIDEMIDKIRKDADDFVGSGNDDYYSNKIVNGLDNLQKELCSSTRCCKCAKNKDN